MAAGLTVARALDPDRLIANAEAAVGSSDWGEAPFQDALERLCREARQESNEAQAPAIRERFSRYIETYGVPLAE